MRIPFFKAQTQMSQTWAINTWVNNRLEAESTNSPFRTWAIIAYYPKLGDALDAQIYAWGFLLQLIN